MTNEYLKEAMASVDAAEKKETELVFSQRTGAGLNEAVAKMERRRAALLEAKERIDTLLADVNFTIAELRNTHRRLTNGR